MKLSGPHLIRWSGVAAMLAGVLFIVMQTIHPSDIPSSVSSGQWVLVHCLGVAMCLFGMLGLTGIYARQVEASGWLGLAGYLLFGLFYALTLCFQFVEAFLSPLLTSEAPRLLGSLLALAGGDSVGAELGALSTVYSLVGALYMVGSLLFGIASFRAGILPRWASGLFAVGGLATAVVVSLFPHPLDRIAAVPIGLGLAWLGYSLWSERRDEG